MDGLWVLEISEKYSRLTEYIGCSVEIVRYVRVANLNLIQYTNGSQCSCLSTGCDGAQMSLNEQFIAVGL